MFMRTCEQLREGFKKLRLSPIINLTTSDFEELSEGGYLSQASQHRLVSKVVVDVSHVTVQDLA